MAEAAESNNRLPMTGVGLSAGGTALGLAIVVVIVRSLRRRMRKTQEEEAL